MKSPYNDLSRSHDREDYHGRAEFTPVDPITERDFKCALTNIELAEYMLTEITSKLSDTAYLSAQMMRKVREALSEVRSFGKEVLIIDIAEPGERRRARRDRHEPT